MRGLRLGYYLAFALGLLAIAWLRPVHNWDVLGYAAAGKAYSTADPETVHAFAYDTVRRSIAPEWYALLVDGDPYRRTMASDPAAFAEQLTYYQVRPLYTLLALGLSRTGVGPVRAAHLVSGAAVAAGAGLLLLLGRRHLRGPMLALPPLALCFGLLEVARISTPDGLAFALVTLAAWLFLAHRPALLVLLPVLGLVRTELVLFSVPLLLILLLWGERRLGATLSLAASIGVFVLLQVLYEHPGWSTSVYATCVERITHPLSAPPPPLGPGEYARELAVAGWRAVNDKAFVLYAVLLGAALVRMRSRAGSGGWAALLRRREAVLLAVCAGYVISHVLLFPMVWERFFVGPYLITAVVFLGQWSDEEEPLARGTTPA